MPGAFVWFGASYGQAISLTALIASVIGVFGWVQIARRYGVSCFVLFFFTLGLVAFRYITVPFREYNGGEVILFAVLPWSLLALQWAASKRAVICLVITIFSAALLFFAKLSGLVAFAANVAAISLLDMVKLRRITSSLLAMWVGSAIALLFFFIFWLARGQTPVSEFDYGFTWPKIWFPVSAAVFSGFSLHDLLSWLFLHPSKPILSNITVTSYVLGPVGLLLLAWLWFRLRNTRYRSVAIRLLAIIASYTAILVAMYIRGGPNLILEERYFRYAGILTLLLLLIAMDHDCRPLPRGIAALIVGVFAVYGLASYAINTRREVMRTGFYDASTGISMQIVSPVVLKYLRSEMAVHNWQHAIVVVPWPEAAVGLPHFRVILDFVFLDFVSLDYITHHQKFSGRAEKLFVIVREKNRDNGKADALLKLFVDYDFGKWAQTQIDGTVLYSQ